MKQRKIYTPPKNQCSRSVDNTKTFRGVENFLQHFYFAYAKTSL